MTDFLILFVIAPLVFGLFTYKFYTAAGRQAWEAFIPIYGTLILLKIIERPWWWVFLVYMPVVGNVMSIVLVFELLHVFGFRKLKFTIYSIITFYVYLAYINYTEKLNYKGRDHKDIRKHVSELGASIIFAVVAATAIRAFTFEAFTIPTPSMEKSLLVGDFLFVSKMHYGVRPPITPLAIPLIHNKIPLSKTVESYSELIQLPYVRLPKFYEVDRNDPVVFNYPAEDIRPINMEGEVRPIDKREHYVKRCLAIPGDSLKIVDGQVYVNGEKNILPERSDPQTSYLVETNSLDFNVKQLKEKFDINYVKSNDPHVQAGGAVQQLNGSPNFYIINIPASALEEFKKLPNVVKVEAIVGKKDITQYEDGEISNMLKALYINNPGYFLVNQELFPNPKNSAKVVYPWTRDNYGPLYMPKEGDVIQLNEDSWFRYQRIITAYEGNTLEKRGNQFILNGEPATEYTFKQGYYWMMGDNRHASDDSRFWGYVPEDHIVGKPVFIWMSFDKYAEGFINKLRYDRIFTTVSGDGPRTSYFWHVFILVIVGYFINGQLKKRKASQKAA